MSTSPESQVEPSSASEAPSGEGKAETKASAEEARYASQAAAAEPAPVAFEGGASTPGAGGGTTPMREWMFLVLAVLFSITFVSIPAVFFTSIDLTAPAAVSEAPAEGTQEARERLQLLQETRADALSKLHTYGPAENGEAFRIPVEQAMRLTLQEEYTASVQQPSVDSTARRP